MKQLFIVIVAILFLTACGNKKSKQENPATTKVSVSQNIPVYELDSLLQVADQLVDKKVKVRGFVTHTCKHAGKRCFIVGKDQKTSFRIEAGGEIGGFNRELTGSELEIFGTVKERRLTQEYIAQYEEQVKEKQAKEDGSAETCEAELKNVEGMKNWMKKNNKPYYSIYYMNGENYEVIEE